MSSTPPEYSRALAADIARVGGRYVEAPVSGSRRPAEDGQLVCLLGGDPDAVAEVQPLLSPMCRATFVCGTVGDALLMKLAVNLLLLTLMAGMAESVHFAQCQGLDLDIFAAIINAGPMASDYTRMKITNAVALGHDRLDMSSILLALKEPRAQSD